MILRGIDMIHLLYLFTMIILSYGSMDLNLSKEAKEMSKLKYGRVELIERR